jgi:hypothetical protein
VERRSEWPRVLEVDYSAARAQAIKWLGDRYLLAKPINGNHCAVFTVPPLALQSMATGAQQSVVARAN